MIFKRATLALPITPLVEGKPPPATISRPLAIFSETSYGTGCPMELLTARSLANRAIPFIPRLALVQHPQRGQHPLLKILRNQKVTRPRPEWDLDPGNRYVATGTMVPALSKKLAL